MKPENIQDKTEMQEGNTSKRPCQNKSRSKNIRKNCKTRNGRKRGADVKSAELDNTNRSNDPNWYFTNPDIASQASQFSFNQFLGQRVDLLPEANGVHSVSNATVMITYLNPCPGWIEELSPLSAGINMQGLKLFTSLSSKNAKTTNYAPQDVTTLMLAMGELISLVEVGRRAFGVAFTYNQRNRMFPREILNALGFEANDFLSHLADYRLKFNTLITMINKIPFPANIAYFDKCAKLYRSVYLDRVSAMAQIYAYMPYATWKFDEAYSEQGTGLKTYDLWKDGNAKTFTDYYQILEELAQAIMTSATFNYIYADVLNYVSKESVPLLNLEYLMEGYSVVPEYNENALLQINNGYAMDDPLAVAPAGFTPNNDVIPNVNKNCIEYRPCWDNAYPHISLNKIVNFNSDTPSVEDRIEATRFTAVGYQYAIDDGKYRTAHVALSDHYIVKYRVCRDSWADNYACSNLFANTDGTHLADLTQFNKAPIAYLFDMGTKRCVNIAGDVDVFTTVDLAYLQRINDLTFAALFELR